MSYAAYRVLAHRYESRFGAEETLAQLDETMAALCLPTDVVTAEGDTPAALGNRIAATIIDFGYTDNSNEADRFEDPDYEPVNDPMLVVAAGAEMNDPNRWQPLAFENMVTQNGLQLDTAKQEFVGPHWGYVTAFALDPAPDDGVPVDPGPPPFLGDSATDAAFKAGAVEVIRYSSLLDPSDGATIDISPATDGNNPLGTYDGAGYDVNPVTGEPYEPNIVPRGDFGRVLAEFWADGPNSETPPGHWNTIANAVADDPTTSSGSAATGRGRPPRVRRQDVLRAQRRDARRGGRRLGGEGLLRLRPADLDDPLHGRARPVVRSGRALVPPRRPAARPRADRGGHARVERGGERHARLARRQGEIAIRAWTGDPGNPRPARRASTGSAPSSWVPYQMSTFVTPAFAGYVSGTARSRGPGPRC